jgi:hypothetical protein
MDWCTVFPFFRSGGDRRPRTYSKRPLSPGPLILPAEEVTSPPARVSDPYSFDTDPDPDPEFTDPDPDSIQIQGFDDQNK